MKTIGFVTKTILLFAIVFCVVFSLFTSCSKSSPNPSRSNVVNNSTNNSDSVVNIQNDSFDPSTINILVNHTVIYASFTPLRTS